MIILHTQYSKTDSLFAYATNRNLTTIKRNAISNASKMKNSKEHDLTTIAFKNVKRIQKYKNGNNVPRSRKLTKNSLMGNQRRRANGSGDMMLQKWIAEESSVLYEIVKFKGNGMCQINESFSGERAEVLNGKIKLKCVHMFRETRIGKNANIPKVMEGEISEHKLEQKSLAESLQQAMVKYENIIGKPEKLIREIETQFQDPQFTENFLRFQTRLDTNQLVKRCPPANAETYLHIKAPVKPQPQNGTEGLSHAQPPTHQTHLQTLKKQLQNQTMPSNRLSTRHRTQTFLKVQQQSPLRARVNHLQLKKQIPKPLQYSSQTQKCTEHRYEALQQVHANETPYNINLKGQEDLDKNNLPNKPKCQRQCHDFSTLEQQTKPHYELRNWHFPRMRSSIERRRNRITPSSPYTCISRHFSFSHFKQRYYFHFLLFTTLLWLLAPLPYSTHAACRNADARPCEAICTSDGINCTLRALLLLPDDDTYLASMRSSMPVLHLAEQYIRNNSLLPAQLHLEWMTDDVKCDASYATIKAMDGISKSCAHVVFGPVCDYALAAVSRIAKYFNSNGTPVISIGGATDSFEDKKTTCADEFYMLLRSGLLSFKSLSVMTIELLKRYNWSNTIALYEPNSREDVVGEHSCFLMMKSFSAEMRLLNLTFAQYSLAPELRNRTEELKREIGNKHTRKVLNKGGAVHVEI